MTATESPREAGFFMPGEWEEQQGVLLSAPLNPETWVRNRAGMEKAYAAFGAAIAKYEKLYLNCVNAFRAGWLEKLERAGADMANVVLFDLPTDDAWCRDHGPIFLKNAVGVRAVVDFNYNAWGGKFPPWDLDNAVPEKIAALFGVRRFAVPFTCEGGALETDGRGTLLTTESVILNPNRNPGIGKAEAEKILGGALGVSRVLWLPSGLPGDDTDGHIDTLARFCDPFTVLAPRPQRRDAPGADALLRNFTLLESMCAFNGERLTVVPLPVPDPIYPEGWREEILPATYTNFLIVNGAVLTPVYGQRKNDAAACAVLERAFPGRDIVPVDCRDILLEGGALHCLSQQIPR